MASVHCLVIEVRHLLFGTRCSAFRHSSLVIRHFVEVLHADNRSPHLQLQRRACRPARVRPRGGAARSADAAGDRHVGARDQPPLEAVRRHHRHRRSGHSRARGNPGRLPRALPAGRRQPAVLDGADEPAANGGHGRLHRDRRLVAEGRQGSEAPRHGAYRRHDRSRQLRPCAAAGRARVLDRRRLRARDVEQHHLRDAVAGHARCRRRPARLRRLVGHLQPADRDAAVRPHLRWRTEEPRPVGCHARHRPRRSGEALTCVAADDAELCGAGGERIALQHAAGVRRLHPGAGCEVVEGAGRSRGHRGRQRAQGREVVCRDRPHRVLPRTRRARRRGRG